MVQKMQLLSVFVTAALMAAVCHAWPPGQNGGWQYVTNQVGLSAEMPFRSAALADWNGDKFLDMLQVDSQNTSLFVTYYFEGNHSFGVNFLHSYAPRRIISVATADINRDSLVDAAVLLSDGTVSIILGIGGAVLEDVLDAPVIAETPHLNLLDVYGRCAMIDIVVVGGDGRQYIYENVGSDGANCNFIGGTPKFRRHRVSEEPVMPTSSAAADVNGDCVADFIFAEHTPRDPTTVTYKIVADVSLLPAGGAAASFKVPSFVGTPAFFDINSDGAVDIVFPSCTAPVELVSGRWKCEGGYDSLLMLPNYASGICSGDNCCGGHYFHFYSVLNVSTDKPVGFYHIPLASIGGCQLPATSAKVIMLDSPLFPAYIRSADFNRDRHDDIAIQTNYGVIVINRFGESLPPAYACTAFLNQQDPSQVPFFFDIDEDGIVDLMSYSTSGTGMQAYWNGADFGDNYFLTALTLNGVKGGGMPYPGWGASQVGAVTRFQWQDIDTTTRSASSTQLVSSAAHAMSIPRCYFGLARTFSYIQNYAAGFRIAGYKSYNEWSAYLMPNSQVVVLPYPLTDSSKWELKLFISTTRFKTLLIIALVTSLTVLGVPIVVLKYREVQADKKELKKLLG